MEKSFREKLLLITYTVALLALILNFEWVFNVLGTLVGVIKPVLWGIALAFLLNLLMEKVEGGLGLLLGRNKRVKARPGTARRRVAVLLTMLIFIGVLILILALLIPQLGQSIMMLADQIPAYWRQIQRWLTELADQYRDQLGSFDLSSLPVDRWADQLGTFATNLVTGLVSSLSGMTGVVANLFVSLVIAVYMLLNKETLLRQSYRLFSVILPEKWRERVFPVARMSCDVMRRFVSGQLTEAVILGVLCLITMSSLRMPYAPLISLIIGFTNLIPFFGPILGTIPCAFLILMVDPLKAVIFVGVILVLQQIDSNLIYPRVVGDSVQLPGMWVLVAIVVGGGLFGIVGMILGVPVFSVIYSVLRAFVSKRYEEQQKNKT